MAYRDRKPSAEEPLLDTVEWSGRPARHFENATAEGFLRGARLQDAVCRCVYVIGEAAGRLRGPDSALQQRHSDPDAYAARNWIAHGYGVVDYAIVWNAATQSVPKTAAAARALLQGGS